MRVGKVASVLRAASFKQVDGQVWLVDADGRRLSTRDSFQLEGRQVCSSREPLGIRLSAVASMGWQPQSLTSFRSTRPSASSSTPLVQISCAAPAEQNREHIKRGSAERGVIRR